LYVEKGGIYYEIPDVDQWPEDRDARGYNGPFPVVAHPPYQRWSSLAKLCESKYGIKAEQDGGCFEHALNCVRKFGGVLEHPSRSLAFKKYLLPTPTKFGVWEYWPDDNSWTIQFNQSTYGHKSQKPTWLTTSATFRHCQLIRRSLRTLIRSAEQAGSRTSSRLLTKASDRGLLTR
jgi:hypothetical protein